MCETIVSWILITGGVIYLGACLAAFSGLFRTFEPDDSFLPDVSVIIAARNEAENIASLLDDLLAQDYPSDRVSIHVVDDFSADDTAHIVTKYARRHDRVHLHSTNNSTSPYTHKKRAVHTGIMASSGEIIMTVDADCRMGASWISGMIGHFSEGVDLVAGEVRVGGESMVADFEILEFTGIQAMSAGLMNAGLPITCNGADLAYRRSAFERVGGYEGFGRVVSGDDDLLMQKISGDNPDAVRYVLGDETSVMVEANESFASFINQRTRWASKIATYPSTRALFLLTIFFLFFLSIPVWFGCALTGIVDWKPLTTGYGFKALGDLLLVGYGLAIRKHLPLLVFFPLAECVHVPYILYVTFRGLFGSFDWHGRRTKAKASS